MLIKTTECTITKFMEFSAFFAIDNNYGVWLELSCNVTMQESVIASTCT